MSIKKLRIAMMRKPLDVHPRKKDNAMPRSVSIENLAEAASRNTHVVVDVRPMAAYNGWVLRNESRGGHAAGAVPFPVAWFSDLEKSDLLQLLQDKGISRERNVVLYGYDSDDAGTAAVRLEELGYSFIRVFNDGLPAWAAEPESPMARLPRYRHLVHKDWLRQLLDTGKAPECDGGPYILAHASFDNRDDYRQGHIPGAISLDTLFLEEPEHWNRRNPDELERALLANGITCDTTVVLYGRHGKPTMEYEEPGRHAGQIAGMRAALLLMYAGVRDVRVLDGGLDAWFSDGNAITTDETTPNPVDDFGCPIPARPDLVVDIKEAKQILTDPMAELVSMRSWPEFIGEKSGYHYIGPRGRIPGAVFGNCGSDAYHMQNYRNHDNTMLCYHEIAASWEEVGIVPEKRIAFYCGTGWRASEGFFCAYLMGWDRIAIYDGGWYEWSLDEGNPVETGIPKGPIIKTRRF
jgi:thiosulfate/3-mercaptopyruvate sulfurtransferase